VSLRTHVMIHHSATPDGVQFNTAAIRRFHTSWRFQDQIITEQKAHALLAEGMKGVIAPWMDCGYHLLVELVGGEYECIVGRHEERPAAACPQGEMNTRAFHICLVGNFDKSPPPNEQLKVAIDRGIARWISKNGIPVERVVGHRDFNPAKSCPGTKFDLELFQEMLR